MSEGNPGAAPHRSRAKTTRHGDEPDADDEAHTEYATVKLDDGRVIIYDSTNHLAWIQSDVAVPLDTHA